MASLAPYERNHHNSNSGSGSGYYHGGNSNGSTPRMRQMMLEAVYEACAAVTHSVLCSTTYLPPPPPSSDNNNNGNGGGGSGDEAVGTIGYVTAAARQQYLAEGTKQVRQLLDEYESLMLQTVERDALRPVAATSATAVLAATSSNSNGNNNGRSGGGSRTHQQQTLVALRARANAKLFAEACKLTVPLSEYRLPASDDDSNNNGNNGSSSKEETDDAQRLRPLTQLLQQVRDVRRCAGYKHEEYLQQLHEKLAKDDEAAAAAATTHDDLYTRSSSSSNTKPPVAAATPYHIPALVRRLEEALETCLELLRSPNNNNNNNNNNADGGAASYVACAASTTLIRGVATWPQGLLRLVNEAVQSDTLEARVERTREQLRRARFDVEELQLQQEQAVSDGDMHRSEELYFHQVAVLEAMTPSFDALEETMQRYRADCGDAARARLDGFAQSFRATLQSAVAAESAARRKMSDDLERLQAARDDVARARAAQRTAAQLYTNEWRRLYDDNAKQQAACLRAMDELERRLRSLGDEATWLVRDRAACVQRERQRDEDALAFAHFAEHRAVALTRSLRHVDTAMRTLQTMGDAVAAGCERLDAYLREAVQAHADDALLRTRKQRLEQFRTLYLTLGDLQFKKARHAEEVAKKIEYYTLQQELAMDALNPKAKEYSQARRQWQEVEQEMQQQLHALEQRSARQLADFRPTEARLLEARVAFTHPQDELAERNFSRTQKLLEYKKLMEDKAAEATKSTRSVADDDDNDDDDESEQAPMRTTTSRTQRTHAVRRHGGADDNDDDEDACNDHHNRSNSNSKSSGDKMSATATSSSLSRRRMARDDDTARYNGTRARDRGGSSSSDQHSRDSDDDDDDNWRRSMARNNNNNNNAAAAAVGVDKGDVPRLRSTEDYSDTRNATPPSVRGGGGGGRRRW